MLPAHLTLHQVLPNADGTKQVCLWEAADVGAVEAFVENALAGLSVNTYFAVEEEKVAKARPAKKVADKAAADKTTKTADQAGAEAAAEGKTLTEAREDGSPAAEGLETPGTEAKDTAAAEPVATDLDTLGAIG